MVWKQERQGHVPHLMHREQNVPSFAASLSYPQMKAGRYSVLRIKTASLLTTALMVQRHSFSLTNRDGQPPHQCLFMKFRQETKLLAW